MADKRIAVLFDAENINCETALNALDALAPLGTVQIKRAVGDFSSASLAGWIGCGRDRGIDLVLQPSLGKGKNGAEIKLTIEAMDIVHQARIDAIALVTRDRDFTPLAMRLRDAGLLVLGFAQAEPSASFRVACSSFVVIGAPPPITATPAKSAPGPILDRSELARLRRLVLLASHNGPITPTALTRAIISAEPDLATRLSGQGKFLRTLVAHGLVERVGSGSGLQVQAPRLHNAG
ncbi:NYN domain-containing protein [Devosia alba]|uniref:NYN domain-containing protein n=1 Tax=Devosia alba TaxID=3152360 RepID=UPI003265D881